MDENKVLLAKSLLEELILSIIAADDAKSRVHFKYISPEWIGMPGWYFWPKDKAGVYYIKLDNVLYKEGGWEIIFALYYYPHPEEEVFANFSFVEQITRISEVFSKKGVAFSVVCPCQSHCEHEEFNDLKDGKGIPTPSSRESLNPWLFRVGSISALWNNDAFQEWFVEAQVLSQTWAIRDISVPDEEIEKHTIINRTSVDRNLPAWELADYFYKSFLSDLQLLGITYSTKEISISSDTCAANKRLFSLVSCG